MADDETGKFAPAETLKTFGDVADEFAGSLRGDDTAGKRRAWHDRAMLSPFRRRAAAVLWLACLAASPAHAQQEPPPTSGTPLPRCLLYNSYRVTPQGLMQCSYQCGDRIIMRSGYQVCVGSWARPAPGEP